MATTTLRYVVTRREVQQFYWVQFRQRLWKSWLIMAACVFPIALWLFMRQEGRPVWLDVIYAALIVLLAVSWFPLFPQLMFKRQDRVLTFGPTGIDIVIGDRSGHRTWKEMEPPTDRDGYLYLVVRATKSAFVIPRRAFASATERSALVDQIRNWIAAAQGRPNS